MKIHAIMVTRDEGDIIIQVIRHLLKMVDFIYVYDTGSLDDTWSKILSISESESRLIPFKSEPAVFFTAIKSYPFNFFRDRFHKGDWIVKADADEFYLEDIRLFIRNKVRWYEDVIYKATKDYRFTSADADAWLAGRETIRDRARSIQDRRKYWETYPYGEARIYRYRPTMKWSSACNEPYFRGVIAESRIPVAHYQDRDPLQMQRRWIIRNFTAKIKGISIGRHAEWSSVNHWRDRVVDVNRTGLYCAEDSIAFPVTWHKRGWKFFLRRWLQIVVYRLFVNFLDASRPAFPESYKPKLYSDNEIALLRNQLEQGEMLP